MVRRDSYLPPRPEPPPPPDNRFNAGRNPNFLGPEYFKDQEQLTWAEGANQRWMSEHGIDPTYGGITGPLGPIPAGIGQQIQAAHDQAVWNARNRMAKESLRFAQGAAGLMTSYRAGGASALYAGVHSNLANIQMQRAQMLQPLDLLGDYRRDMLARAGSGGRTESVIGTVLQGVGAIASVAGYPYLGIPLSAAGGALQGVGQSKQNASFARAGASQQAVGGQPNMAMQATQAMQSMAGQYRMGQTQQGFSGNQPGQGGQAVPGLREKVFAEGGGVPGQAAPGQQSVSPQGQYQEPQAQNAQLRSMQQPGMGGMGGMGVVGSNGDFSPLAYAANGAATSVAPQHMQLAMSENLAGNLRDDPSWSIISMAIDRELAYRTVGVG